MDRRQFLVDLLLRVSKSEKKKAFNVVDDASKGLFLALQLIKDNEGLTAGELAKKFKVSTARVAVVLRTLEEKGYIIKQVDKKDKRKVIIKISPLGLEKHQENQIKVLDKIVMLFDNFTDEELITFTELLVKIKPIK